MLSTFRKSRKHNCWASFLGERILKLFINNKKKVHNKHVRLDALFRCYCPESYSAMAVPSCLLYEEALFNHIVLLCVHGCRIH